MMLRYIYSITIVLTLVVSSLPFTSQPVSAAQSSENFSNPTVCDYNRYMLDDISDYEPCLKLPVCSTNLGGGVSLGQGTNFEKIAKYFADKGMKHTAIAGILANLHVESGLSPFRIQNQSQNTTEHKSPPVSLGYGIAQFTPSSKIGNHLSTNPSTSGLVYTEYYSTKYGGAVSSWENGGNSIPEGVPEEVNDAWLLAQLNFFYEGEMQTTKVGAYRNKGGVMGLDYIKDDETILQAMQNAKDEKDAARIFIWIYERPADKPGGATKRSSLATDMLSSVGAVIGSGDTGDVSPLSSTTSSANCTPSGSTLSSVTGGVAGLQATVKSFAWEDGRRGPAQKPDYTAALVGRYKGGNNGNDCGAFVSALMVKSGFEPNYPGTNSAGQAAWLAQNWQRIASVGSVDVSQLQPGDVAYKPGHVFVWIGDVEGFVGKSAEAALGSNTAPTAIKSSNTYSDPSKYIWYRKGAGGCTGSTCQLPV